MGTDHLENAKPIQEAPIHGYSPNQSTVGKRQNQHAGRTFRLTLQKACEISPFKSERLDYLNNDVFWRISSLSYKQISP